MVGAVRAAAAQHGQVRPGNVHSGGTPGAGAPRNSEIIARVARAYARRGARPSSRAMFSESWSASRSLATWSHSTLRTDTCEYPTVGCRGRFSWFRGRFFASKARFAQFIKA
ncbi:protein of unknown function [Micropruina glycogenica]|uniref:Uncharacterized protein n=1 Tax=Micropruina glycogenica TaxID=75385 RepID=A0A2N9JMT4_9ACTN|nr:protein of unknown function [Micropruina glycogenica]